MCRSVLEYITIDKMAEHRIVNAFDGILSVSSKLVIESFHLIVLDCGVCVRACVHVLGESKRKT